MNTDQISSFRGPRIRTDRVQLRSTPLSIISVGRDAEILRLRQEVICGRSDLSVRSFSPEEAEPWTHRPEPHLWIFCYTVELPRLVYLSCRVLRFSPESKLLLLEGRQRTGFEASLFHQVLRRTEGEGPFLDALERLAVAV